MNNNVKEILVKNHLKGIVLIIHKGQPTLISEGFADAKQKILNGAAKTVYPLASLQKPLTAAAIYLLIKNQQLQLSTTLNHFFPKIPQADQITVDNLLTHSSGLVAPEKGPEVTLLESGAINWQLGQLAVCNLPGEKFNYTNLNYVLLAGIIRQITRQSYQQFLTENILLPAGIKNTFFWNNLPHDYYLAKSYIYEKQDYENENQLKASLAATLLGAGNLYGTPEDYYLLQQSLINGKVLTADDYRDLIAGSTKSTSNYHGGMYHENWQGINYKYIFGYLSGNGTKNDHPNYANEMYLSEDNQNGIILFTNQSPNALKNKDFKNIAQTLI